MDEKQLLAKLNAIVSELQAISTGLGTTAGVGKGGKGQTTLSRQELAKIKATADETAKVYKKTLGLGYNQKDADSTAERFRIKFGLTPFFNSMNKYMKDIRDELSTMNKFLVKNNYDKQTLDELYLLNKNISSMGSNVDVERAVNSLYLSSQNIEQAIKSANLGSGTTTSALLAPLQNIEQAIKSANLGSGTTTSALLAPLQNIEQAIKSANLGSGTTTSALLAPLQNIEQAIKSYSSDVISSITSLLPSLQNVEQAILSLTDKVKPKSSDFVKKWYTMARVLRWDDLRSRIINYFDKNDRRNSSINNSLLSLVSASQKTPTDKKEKKSTIGEAFNKIATITGLLALGAGLFFIVNAFITSNKINPAQTFKILGVIGGFVLLFLMVGLVVGKIKNAAIGFAIFSGTMLFLVLPMLKKLSEMDFGKMMNGLAKFSLISAACLAILYGMSKIKKINVLVSMVGILAMVGIMKFILLPFFESLSKKPWEPILKGLGMMTLSLGVFIGIIGLVGFAIDKFKKEFAFGAVGLLAATGILFLMGYVMEQFADKPWDEIIKGLGLATLAIVGFVAVTTLLGAALVAFLPAAALGAVALVASGVLIWGLISLMDSLADTLLKYNTIDTDKLISLGKALPILGDGMKSLILGSSSGITSVLTDKLASFFNVDPATKLKEFEKLDAQKILNLGTGLKNMGDGLRMLSSGIDLKNITKDIIYMTKPLKEFAQSVDSFSASYNNLDKVKVQASIDQNYKLNVEKDNGIQLEIKKLHDLEITIQQDQLTELRNINSNLVRSLGSGGIAQNSTSSPQGESMQSIKSTSFNTKNSYMNNLKLTSMALGG